MSQSTKTHSQSSIEEIYKLLSSLNRKIVKDKLETYGILDEEYNNSVYSSNGIIQENEEGLINTAYNINADINSTKPKNQFREKLKSKYNIKAE